MAHAAPAPRSKTRVQPYQGLIIAMHKHALNSTITVRKTFQGVGVERVFPVHSPLITVEEVTTAGVPRVRAPHGPQRAPGGAPGAAGAPAATRRRQRSCNPSLLSRSACAAAWPSTLLRLRRATHPPAPQVRRAKLYYLRDRVGKAARLKQEFISSKPVKGTATPPRRVEAAAAEAPAPVPVGAA